MAKSLEKRPGRISFLKTRKNEGRGKIRVQRFGRSPNAVSTEKGKDHREPCPKSLSQKSSEESRTAWPKRLQWVWARWESCGEPVLALLVPGHCKLLAVWEGKPEKERAENQSQRVADMEFASSCEIK